MAKELDDLSTTESARLLAIIGDLEAARWNSWDRNIKVIPIILKGSPTTFLSRLGGLEYKVEQSSGTQTDRFDVRLSNPTEESLAKNTQIVFFRLLERIWLLVTIEPRLVFKHLVRRISRLGSIASPVFLSTRDVSQIFSGLCASEPALKILQHSAYNQRESSIRFLRTERLPGPVFKELLAAGLVVRRITGGVTDASGVRRIHFRLANNGAVSLTLGSLRFLIEQVMLAIASVARKKDALFSNRVRGLDSFQPLSIRFDRKVLQDKASNHNLVSILARTDRMGVGVFHSNPYIHLILTDFRDGSRFTLYSTSDESLELVPSYRASVSSIMRIYRTISEDFASCEVLESTQLRYTLADFFDGE